MNCRICSHPAVFAALVFATIFPEPAWPQSEPSQRGTLDEIVTTARRVEESLQDTPISVTAFTADDLRDRMILSTEQSILALVCISMTCTWDNPSAGRWISEIYKALRWSVYR
jgi:outer membrane receptor for ferrienterochelin and colicin